MEQKIETSDCALMKATLTGKKNCDIDGAAISTNIDNNTKVGKLLCDFQKILDNVSRIRSEDVQKKTNLIGEKIAALKERERSTNWASENECFLDLVDLQLKKHYIEKTFSDEAYNYVIKQVNAFRECLRVKKEYNAILRLANNPRNKDNLDFETKKYQFEIEKNNVYVAEKQLENRELMNQYAVRKKEIEGLRDLYESVLNFLKKSPESPSDWRNNLVAGFFYNTKPKIETREDTSAYSASMCISDNIKKSTVYITTTVEFVPPATHHIIVRLSFHCAEEHLFTR
jgi:hypothetical protein